MYITKRNFYLQKHLGNNHCKNKLLYQFQNLRFNSSTNIDTIKNKHNLDKLINPYGIQCLQPDLKEKVFGKKPNNAKSNNKNTNSKQFQDFKAKVLKIICDKSLENFQLKGKSTSRFDPVKLKHFPDLEAPDLESHFLKIGKYLADPYTKIIDEFLPSNKNQQKYKKDQDEIKEKLEVLPKSWLIEEGWVKYSLHDEKPPVKVDFPNEEFLTFDVETLPQISNYPVMAAAKSKNYIYCWLSPALIKAYHHYKDNDHLEREYLQKWKEEQMKDVPLLDAALNYEKHLHDIEQKLEVHEGEVFKFNSILDEKRKISSEMNKNVFALEEELSTLVDKPVELIKMEDKADFITKFMANDSNITKRDASKVYVEEKNIVKKKNSELKTSHRLAVRELKSKIKEAKKELKNSEKIVHKYEKILKDNKIRIEKLQQNRLKRLGQIENVKKETYEKHMAKLDKQAADLDVYPVELDSQTLQTLCPVNPTNEKRVIVGHNVSYDRARILEEYNYKGTNNFFMDTLSLHVAVSGMCSKQRLMYFHYKKLKKMSEMDYDEYLEKEGHDANFDNKEELFVDFESEIEQYKLNASGVQYENPWLTKTSMNSLKECAKFYLNYTVDKDIRDVFVESKTYKPVVEDIQNLITYCASDTVLTEEVFKTVYPEFKARLPHPVSTAALKSMGQAFLPVNNKKWENYINTCESMYLNYTEEIQQKINLIIEGLLKQYEKDKYFWANDPWLSQLDWEEIPWKVRKDGIASSTQNRYAGKPAWFKSICKKPGEIGLTVASKLIPIFFKLKYLGKPVVFDEIWMDKDYKISKKMNSLNENQIKKFFKMTDQQLETLKSESEGLNSIAESDEVDENLEKPNPNVFFQSAFANGFIEKSIDKKSLKLRYCLCIDVDDPNEIQDLIDNKNHRLTATPTVSGKGSRVLILHPDDEMKRVTRLISKAFKSLFENGSISSDLSLAKEALDIVTKCSYWVSNRKRIMGQWVVNKGDLKASNDTNEVIRESMLQDNKFFDKDEKFEDHDGMILPGLITMGTVTRRAVENTWLTASNIKPNRIGSELKSLIEAPPGYCFVGADVDSEELWIGSLIADSLYENHGSTPLGWMTLEGTKKEGTDMHTTTAKILNTSRDNAKIFNYSRIYGAGKRFTAQLLKKLDPNQTQESCQVTTDNLYLRTKGNKHQITDIYFGGSESALFTKLTEIAEKEDCRTPVLKAKITKCLSSDNNANGNYITSRINWIIQSSGVDYLHLLITSMEYLIKKYNLTARLVISIHDEIRFMCKEEDKYRTAMALQISNIWTRAMFCKSLHMDDLPQSCAFFSGVDIDKVLRKEVDIDCVTVSNKNPIPPGEVLDIYKLNEKIGDSLVEDVNNDLSIKDIPVDDLYNKLKKLSYEKTEKVTDIIKLAAINEESEEKLDNFLKKMSLISRDSKNLERYLSNMFLGTNYRIQMK
ncbi:uncharacterized protein HGUI_00981 [Hanseniaspora guilliermondii]|uniref:Mitochondrial DNA polymerase catalytic subunit n=1 Tax=Hanseniaspora guilliermondii TaxID=56406 RepID=A0A1L0CJ29_9ASCO|nr:uncharacterized protein HGUI_00981 [Hanseniaspora guilliermondii]